jgi:hypothetical protein
MRTRAVAFLALCVMFLVPQLAAQDIAPAATKMTDTLRVWNMETAVLGFLYTDTIALWNPSFTADHGHLHVEARYQWEDWRTGSVWIGRNFSFGDALSVTFTPMVGGVFGYTNGVAPGYLLEMEWRSLYFYSSSEYLFNLEDNSANFGYTWTELTVDLDHLLFGIVAQRTRPFESSLDLQRGLSLMREQGAFTFGMYLFNLGWTDPTVVLNLAYAFDVPKQRRASTTP